MMDKIASPNVICLLFNIGTRGIKGNAYPHLAALWRHMTVSELNASKDIRTLQELLGHTNISTTMQYVHPDMDRMRSLLETFSS